MSHLGARVTALVDGRLGPDAAERALAHVAVCDRCRSAVQEERAIRRLLAGEGRVDEPPASLTRALLDLGGPSGPLPPPRPRPPGLGTGPGSGPDPLRLPPRDPAPHRALAATVGTAVLVAVVALGVALAATPLPAGADGTAATQARGGLLERYLPGGTAAPAAVLLADAGAPGAGPGATPREAASGDPGGTGAGSGSGAGAAEQDAGPPGDDAEPGEHAAGGWWARTVRGARVLACLLTAT